MKYYLALVVILFYTKVGAQNSNSDYFVSDLKQNNLIKISSVELNLLAKQYGQLVNITELKLEKVSDHYFLLAKDITHKWIMAFELKSIGTKLYIEINSNINVCESENLSISIFNILNGQIDGCVKLNHQVLSRL